MANKKMLAAAFAVVMSGGITALPMHAAAAQGVTDQASSSAEIRNQYIVTLAPNIVERLGVTDLRVAIQTLLSSVGGAQILHTYEHALTGMAVRLTGLQAQLLKQLPGVVAIEQDQMVYASAFQTNPVWGLDRIDQPTLPLDSRYGYPAQAGTDVTVYVIDTGLRATHQEFAGRVAAGRNFVASGGGFLFGGGSVNPNDTNDCNGHGTHVAGSAVGTQYGVAKEAFIAPIRVLDCNGSGSNSAVIAGVDWVVANHRKPAVANMSLGGGNSTALDAAVRNAVDAGVSMVVAAGNDNANACSGSPNRVAQAVTVGATTRTDQRASYSNFGECVDIFAPGSDITSAWYQSDSQTARLNGTSMAAPHVAGAAALLLGENPNASPQQVFDTLVVSGVENVLSGVRTGSPNLLLQVAENDGSVADRSPTAAFTVDCDGTVCTFDGRDSSDDNGVAAWSWEFGDGAQASGSQVTHDYQQAGTFSVALTVFDTINQTAQTTQSVVIEDTSNPCPTCTRYEGTLANGGSAATNGFSVSQGTLTGFLYGPADAVFSLTLERRRCFLFSCSWSGVQSVTTDQGEAQLQASVNSGTYRWRVRANSGAGKFVLLADPR